MAFAAGGLAAVDQPARASAIPRLVPAERLPSAIALNQLNFQLASIVGPAVGGLLIATVGLAGAYAVDLVSFIASLTALLVDPPAAADRGRHPPGSRGDPRGPALRARRRAILGSFVIDLNAMIFGMPTSLFPVLALSVFDTGAAGFGLMAAAPGRRRLPRARSSRAGSASVRRTGRAILWAVVAWGLAITAFGLVTVSFPLALFFLAVAGAADVFSAVFRSTLVQLDTPDELRGRVMSIHALVVTSGPRLGDIEAAVVATLTSPQFAVVSGGVLCVIGVGVVARWFPELARHTIGSPAGKPAERAVG